MWLFQTSLAAAERRGEELFYDVLKEGADVEACASNAIIRGFCKHRSKETGDEESGSAAGAGNATKRGFSSIVMSPGKP